MTIRDCLSQAALMLQRAGVEEARLNAEWLLAWCYGLKRMQLYLRFDEPLDKVVESKFREMLLKRTQRVPLQHLLGTAEFLGRAFEVNECVLIPRPETEVLAQTAIDKLGGRTLQAKETKQRVLDFGTGSGCLAITVALEFLKNRYLEIVGLDKSEEALKVARKNAKKWDVESRIQFLCGDGWSGIPLGESNFDFVITNPPYIPTRDISNLMPEVKNHEPRMALDGGEDGLTFYRDLAGTGKRHIACGGWLLAEFGDDQGSAIFKIFELEGWANLEILKDEAGKDRILVARRVAE